jgi:uncharacterized protein YkuJ
MGKGVPTISCSSAATRAADSEPALRERQRTERVKCVSVPRFHNANSFAVNVVQHKHGGRAAYTSDDIDFLAAYVIPHNAFYVIPVDVLNQRKMIIFAQ